MTQGSDLRTITLTRLVSSRRGTLGVLHDKDFCYSVTLEDPWRNNKVGESCIPEGVYLVTPHSGTKYKNVWIVNDVPGRSAILIHWGNTENDTQGCILAGMSFVPDQVAITQSRKAVDNLRIVLPKRFLLNVTSAYPK